MNRSGALFPGVRESGDQSKLLECADAVMSGEYRNGPTLIAIARVSSDPTAAAVSVVENSPLLVVPSIQFQKAGLPVVLIEQTCGGAVELFQSGEEGFDGGKASFRVFKDL